jgi:hypothetical protein
MRPSKEGNARGRPGCTWVLDAVVESSSHCHAAMPVTGQTPQSRL